MNKLLSALTLALAVLSTSANGQSRTELARQYISLPASQAMIQEMFSPETMYQQVRSGLPSAAKISNAKKRRIGKVASQGMLQIVPAFNKVMISEAARTFTKAELKAMIAFYSTPEGASILSKTARFTTKSMRRLEPQLKQVQRAILPAILNIIRN